MDSTAGGHGPDDTRKPSDPLSERNAPILTTSGDVEPSGLGIGTIALDTTRVGNGDRHRVERRRCGQSRSSSAPAIRWTTRSPELPSPGPQPVPASYDVANAGGQVSSFGAAYNYGPADSAAPWTSPGRRDSRPRRTATATGRQPVTAGCSPTGRHRSGAPWPARRSTHRSSASRAPRTRAATGRRRPTAGSSPSGRPRSLAPWVGGRSTPPSSGSSRRRSAAATGR